MPRHPSPEVLRSIGRLRAVQRIAAESATQHGERERRVLDEGRSSRVRALNDVADAWSATLARPQLDTAAMAGWAGAIIEGEAGLRGHDDRIAEAADAQKARIAQWRIAIVRADIAERAARVAARSAVRRREEAATGALADRISRLGSVR